MKFKISEINKANKYLRKENSKFTNDFVKIKTIPPDVANKKGAPIQMFRNKDFLAQLFIENGKLRLSINRTQLNTNGDWMDNISWDELFMIKNSCGFAENDAVEIFPREEDYVNVANLRHLWIMKEPLEIAWRKKKSIIHRLPSIMN